MCFVSAAQHPFLIHGHSTQVFLRGKPVPQSAPLCLGLAEVTAAAQGKEARRSLSGRHPQIAGDEDGLGAGMRPKVYLRVESEVLAGTTENDHSFSTVVAKLVGCKIEVLVAILCT